MDGFDQKKEKLWFYAQKHSVLADVMVPVKRSNVSVRSTISIL